MTTSSSFYQFSVRNGGVDVAGITLWEIRLMPKLTTRLSEVLKTMAKFIDGTPKGSDLGRGQLNLP